MKIAALIMSAALSFYLVFGFIFVPAGVSDAAESGVSLSLPEGYLEAVGGDARMPSQTFWHPGSRAACPRTS